jgi:hypothetical protein
MEEMCNKKGLGKSVEASHMIGNIVGGRPIWFEGFRLGELSCYGDLLEVCSRLQDPHKVTHGCVVIVPSDTVASLTQQANSTVSIPNQER